MLETVREEQPRAVKSALESLGAVWLDAFSQLLSQDAGAEVQQNWESLSIRIEIFRVSSICHPLNTNSFVLRHYPSSKVLSPELSLPMSRPSSASPSSTSSHSFPYSPLFTFLPMMTPLNPLRLLLTLVQA